MCHKVVGHHRCRSGGGASGAPGRHRPPGFPALPQAYGPSERHLSCEIPGSRRLPTLHRGHEGFPGVAGADVTLQAVIAPLLPSLPVAWRGSPTAVATGTVSRPPR